MIFKVSSQAILWFYDIDRTADPTWPKGYPIIHGVVVSNTKNTKLRKRRRGGHSLLRHLSSKATTMHTEALLPSKCLDIICWWEVENNFFSFVSMCSLCFSLLNCFYLDPWVFHLILSPPVPLREWESHLVGTWQPDKVNSPQILKKI